MNGTHTRLALLLALSALAFVACGGASTDSPLAPAALSDDATFSSLGNGSGNAGAETPAGDGVCDGCDGTCDGTGPYGNQGNGNAYGPQDGSCDGTCDGSGPHGDPGNGYGPGDGSCDGTGYGPGDGTCDGSCDTTSPEGFQALLVEALQEEYKAEWTYRRVLVDLGDVAPFSFIAESEAQHVRALQRLFARRDWTAPESVWTLDNVATFATLPAACAAGVAVEIEDGALYDGFLSRDDLPQDAVNVFTNLRAASLDAHLPAFQACQ
jgi:hypothetical protein